MKSILCYGDSNTHGQIPNKLNGRYKRHIRWTGVLQKILGEEYYVIEEGLCGRTTVWDDPIEENKNGKKYLLPCLDSHRPLDLVIIVLGTNDLKKRYSVSVFDISWSIENLVKTIQKSESGVNGGMPEILLVTPVPIRDVGNKDFNMMLEGGVEKSKELASYYKEIAERYCIHYLNPGEAVELSEEDGIHYTERGHQTMAELIAKKVGDIFA